MLIDARIAADLAQGDAAWTGPRTCSRIPTSGKVYVMLTNNERRRPEQVDKANPRAAERVRPHHRDDGAGRRPRGRDLHLGHPDQVRRPARRRGRRAVESGDQRRRLVRLARQLRLRRRRAGCGSRPTRASAWARKTGKADGLYAVGDRRRGARPVASCSSACPVGAEMCGPVLHAGRRDAVPGRAASGDRRRQGLEAVRPRVRPSRTRRRAGRTSSPTCRRGPR